MVDAQKLLGVDVMTGHWEFTLGAERVKADRRPRLRGQDRFRRAEREDRRLRRPGVPAVRDARTVNGVPVAIVGQAFPYTPIANPRYFVADWTFGIQDERAAEGRRRGARQGRAGRRAAVAQRHGRRPEARHARDRHRRDPRRPHARRRAAADDRRQRRGRTLVTNAGSNGKFLAVLDLDVKGGEGRRLSLPAAAGVRDLLPPDPAMAALIRKASRAVRGEARREARRHRGPALPPRQLQRHRRPADPRRPAWRRRTPRSRSRRASAGARRCCPARRSRSST